MFTATVVYPIVLPTQGAPPSSLPRSKRTLEQTATNLDKIRANS